MDVEEVKKEQIMERAHRRARAPRLPDPYLTTATMCKLTRVYVPQFFPPPQSVRSTK